jgi:hypothetical protein
MAKKKDTKEIVITMAAGFLKILIDRLYGESRYFDMRVSRIKRGVWSVKLEVQESDYDYFNNLIEEIQGKSV